MSSFYLFFIACAQGLEVSIFCALCVAYPLAPLSSRALGALRCSYRASFLQISGLCSGCTSSGARRFGSITVGCSFVLRNFFYNHSHTSYVHLSTSIAVDLYPSLFTHIPALAALFFLLFQNSPRFQSSLLLVLLPPQCPGNCIKQPRARELLSPNPRLVCLQGCLEMPMAAVMYMGRRACMPGFPIVSSSIFLALYPLSQALAHLSGSSPSTCGMIGSIIAVDACAGHA
ncbi:hypothetical protein DFH11DRAFT_314624 [Phellopilus nigrolimitatus]|nr:hypothetical protein DFH11DRAFT_314624 [Phellopilus nigrolimitatus]